MKPKDNIKILNNKVNEYRNQIKDILRTNGYNSMTNSLQELLNELENMYILNPKHTYKLAITNDEGYVIGIREFDTSLLYYGEIPTDLDMHYYKLINNELVLDEKLKEELLSLD